ncbi:hypothetical protein [Salinarimonas soli]|uniref:Uncharacterized protein n=1 Tax=Salinarimonas soli TaxID=1638099 RepID=A0A5B2VSA9_9HYPH|nr:hypothetical protein [Salinarimonas soli]KAA2241132.1 hypothetical protein F0L46_04865 [Salinarimonas soli]
MAIRFRTYILDDSGRLKRVPRRISEGLVFGDDAIPEYAGTRQRVIEVVVENEDGRPARILDAKGCFWTFDHRGCIDKDLEKSAWAAMQFAFEGEKGSRGKIVDLRPELKRKAFQNEHRWEVSSEDLDRVAADLWPNLVDSPEVTVVKGKAPRRPALSHDARDAIREIMGKISDIGSSLEDLSEHALKGLAFEARRLATAYPIEGGPIWAVVAGEADRYREIKARRRTGRGRWYACLTLFMEEEDKHVIREIDCIEVLCTTREEAVEAVRKLLVENAHRVSDKIRIETDVFSELEHVPRDLDDRLSDHDQSGQSEAL